jgi:hypothetical protein
MSIDVLTYNTLNNENQLLRTTSASLTTGINNLNSECSGYQTTINTSGPQIVSSRLIRPELWSIIPTGSGWTTGFKVCDTSGFFRCGACCAWTVPGGVTCARFQIWGAGAGSGAAGCCGGSGFGGTGAYASVIIPVTAGNVYTLCAGCALCCYASWNQTSNANGCASYVTGSGLTNFCAAGGIGNICAEIASRRTYFLEAGIGGGASIPSITDLGEAFSYLGYCLCATGSSFCSNAISTPYNYNGCLTCGGGFMHNPHMLYQMEHATGSLPYGSATCGTVFGIRGSFTETCMNHYCKCGYMKSAPIYGFESESQCCFQIQGGTTCGGNYCAASSSFGAVIQSMRIPGAGGFAMQVAGGCLSICGDAGRMGMVCVSYK